MDGPMPKGKTIADVKSDLAKVQMSKARDAALDAKLEKAEMGGHRGLLNGRNFMWNVFRNRTKEEMDNFRSNMDTVFPNAPGAGF